MARDIIPTVFPFSTTSNFNLLTNNKESQAIYFCHCRVVNKGGEIKESIIMILRLGSRTLCSKYRGNHSSFAVIGGAHGHGRFGRALSSTPTSLPSRNTTLPTRDEQISTLVSSSENKTEFDVLVIGGGATGAGAALDATTRGLSTVLIEKGDFGNETSSRST